MHAGAIIMIEFGPEPEMGLIPRLIVVSAFTVFVLWVLS